MPRLLVLLPLAVGCMGSEGAYLLSLGATPGGAQDIGYVRDVIAQGGVPYANDLTVEGLLSEHHLPSVGPPCEDLLCTRPAIGIGPDLASDGNAAWVHLGMSSGLPVPYTRPPTDLMLVVDSSGQMAVDMAQTMEASVRLVRQLRSDDRLGLIHTNGTVHVQRELAEVTDLADIEDELRSWRARGSFDIDAGVQTALAKLREAGRDPRRQRRVVVLTCGYPAVNADLSDPFSRAVLDAGNEGIGLTAVGVLLGWDPNFADLLGTAHGGSYHYVMDLSSTETVFDTELDTMISPIAYDLDIAVSLSAGWTLAQAYGMPGEHEPGHAGLSVPTVFPSSRGGGVMLRLEGPDPLGVDTGAVTASYIPDSAHGMPGGGPETLPIGPLPAEASLDLAWYEGRGVHLGAVLVNQAEQMRTAFTEFHDGDSDSAIETVEDVVALMEETREDLDEPALDTEIAMLQKLISNMR